MENRGLEGLSDVAVELISGNARAHISTLGAECVAWSVSGRELLWGRETQHWDRAAPVLFPTVGWSRDGRVQIAGRSYAMQVHGFAANMRFKAVSHDAASAVFELADSEATRKHFPFAFGLRVRYALEAETLRVALEVSNPGAETLPYACGLHPGFARPLSADERSDYQIEFAEVENNEVPVITSGGLFSSERRGVPLQGRTLALDDETFRYEALCFLNARSKHVSLVGRHGAIRVEADGFRHWALWSRPGAPFVCVEAWTGYGDPEGFIGEFADKPSMEHLAPGEVRRHEVVLRWQAR